MDSLTVLEFIEFLDSFKDYLWPVSKISKSGNKDGDSLIDNSFLMYSLDDIVRDCDLMKNNLPMTCDAVFTNNKKNFVFYIVEFKFFSLDDNNSRYTLLNAMYKNLKKKNKRKIDDYSSEKLISDRFLMNFKSVKDNFIDSVELSLRLKPYETIMVALPGLYEQYCLDNPDIQKKDIKKFLADCDIKLIIFLNRYAPHRNISAERLYAHSMSNALKHQYDRLVGVKFIKDYSIRSSFEFDLFLTGENLQ